MHAQLYRYVPITTAAGQRDPEPSITAQTRQTSLSNCSPSHEQRIHDKLPYNYIAPSHKRHGRKTAFYIAQDRMNMT